jgi:hypothetical protein
MATPTYYTVARPDRGLRLDLRPHLIPSKAWIDMFGFRARFGTIDNLPGYVRRSQAPLQTPPISVISEFTQLDGTSNIVVGTADHFYHFHPVDQTTTDITGLTAPLLAPGTKWHAFQFFDVWYAVCLDHRMVGWVGTGTFVQTIVGAPQARSAAVIKDHICVLNTVDELGVHPQRFQWAHEGSDNDWVPKLTNDAGGFDLIDTPDPGVGLFRLGDDVIAYKERTIIPITYIGGNEVFGRRTAISNVGLLSTHGIVNLGNRHYFMGPDMFYSYAGGLTVEYEFGLPVKDSVYSRLHPHFRHNVLASWLDATDEIYFFYPTIQSRTGFCDECIIFNTKESTWYGPYPLRDEVAFVNTAYTSLVVVIDQVTSIVDQTTEVIDATAASVMYPLDLFADSSGNLNQFFGQDAAGVPVERRLQSGDHFLGEQTEDDVGTTAARFRAGSVFMVTGLNIEVGNVDIEEPVFVSIGHRMDLNDSVQWTPEHEIVAAARQQLFVPFRCSGRWFRVNVRAPASRKLSLAGFQYVFSRVGRR